MELRETVLVDAPVDAVWELVQDPHAVAACFPGAELLGSDGAAHDGRITVKFGPTTVAFNGRAEITPDDERRVVTIAARGRDGRGATRASAQVVVGVHAEDGGRTRIETIGDVDVVGPLAQFARTGGLVVTRQLLRDFGVSVTARLATPAGPAGTTAAEPVVAPASAVSVLWRALTGRVREWLTAGRARRRVR